MNRTRQILKEIKTLRAELYRLRELSGQIMNAERAALYLGLSKKELAGITRPGRMLIPCTKPGGYRKRFLLKHLQQYLQKQESEPV